MIRRPPRSTLFPTRRSSDLVEAVGACNIARNPNHPGDLVEAAKGLRGDGQTLEGANPGRSEEHTSELQSRQYLVCRLLLEKKKTQNTSTTIRNIKLQLTQSH